MSTVAQRRPAAPSVAGAAAPPTSSVTVIEPWKPGVVPRLVEIWQYRALLGYLARELVMRRYRKTYLGWWWIPLRPAIQIVAGGFVFGGVLSVAYGNRPYMIGFAFSTAAWIIFERSLHWGTRSIRLARAFARGRHFPRTLAVFSSAGPAIVDFLLNLLVAIIAVFVYLIIQGKWYLAPPQQMAIGMLGLLMLITFGLSVSLVTGPLAMITKEVRYIVSYLVQFWYFITPIVIPLSEVPENLRPVMQLNPLTGPVQMVQFGFISTSPPDPTAVLSSIVGLFIAVVGGLQFFSRFERGAVSRL